MTDTVGTYKEKRIPRVRRTTFDIGASGRRRHHVAGLLELDVTEARKLIHRRRRETGGGLSLTAWAIKCIATAISEHPGVQAYRRGEKRLVVFDDVDMIVVVERSVDGEKLPLSYMMRRADRKSMDEIHGEIVAATTLPASEVAARLGERQNPMLERIYMHVPRVLRRLVWRRLERDPFFAKKYMGTAMFTSLTMFGKVDGWPLPVSVHPVCFALGPVVTKPGVVGGDIVPREFLKMTVLVDHDVIDGGPAARFVARLAELIEGAYGLAGDAQAG